MTRQPTYRTELTQVLHSVVTEYLHEHPAIEHQDVLDALTLYLVLKCQVMGIGREQVISNVNIIYDETHPRKLNS